VMVARARTMADRAVAAVQPCSYSMLHVADGGPTLA